jgi:hypothetical protein
LPDSVWQRVAPGKFGTASNTVRADARGQIGLARFVDESIAEFDFDDLIQRHIQRDKVMSLLLIEAYKRDIPTKVIHERRELREFNIYLEARIKVWEEETRSNN